jgi:glycosyltransferase involved in cell wall biosynthesis
VAEPLKVHILFPFREGPWGGCNQFLTALREELRLRGSWAETPDRADIVLFDSFNAAKEVVSWKRRLPGTPFVQRVDGPVSRYRGADRYLDTLIHEIGRTIADGVVFQSRYSESANRALGFVTPVCSTVILNAPDVRIFSPKPRSANGSVRLVATSWSSNWNKGFEIYRYLDENLDFSRYQMTFVGNSPIRFRNIKQLPAQDSLKLADLLREHDVYVTASRDDPCSNSLAEALASGLPAVALESGGHPELVGSSGVLFRGANDVLAAIDRTAAQLNALKRDLSSPTISDKADAYLDFLTEVHSRARPPRKVSVERALFLRARMQFARVCGMWSSARARIKSPLRVKGSSQFQETVAKVAARSSYRFGCGLMAVLGYARSHRTGAAVHYGGARIGDVGGPLVKIKRLSERFPNRNLGFNLVYLLSNAPYQPAWSLRTLKARGVPIVFNQNGVFYPGWYAGDWRSPNRTMAEGFHLADWVFFQSEFCRRAAHKFLGEREGPGEILYNAVDTKFFRPVVRERAQVPFTFLITGKIGDHLAYRLESSISGLARAREQGLDARLVIAGFVGAGARSAAEQLAQRLRVADHVEFTGPYRQENAPSVYGRADAYVMTKYNDPCPNTVLEALACGLPVLYSNSGGVPELVGSEAGVALDCGEEDWTRPKTPSVDDIASGMLRIAQAHEDFSVQARRRAVERFDIVHWIERHRTVFNQLLEQRR